MSIFSFIAKKEKKFLHSKKKFLKIFTYLDNCHIINLISYKQDTGQHMVQNRMTSILYNKKENQKKMNKFYYRGTTHHGDRPTSNNCKNNDRQNTATILTATSSTYDNLDDHNHDHHLCTTSKSGQHRWITRDGSRDYREETECGSSEASTSSFATFERRQQWSSSGQWDFGQWGG